MQIRPPRVVHFAPVRVAHNVPESLAHYTPESSVESVLLALLSDTVPVTQCISVSFGGVEESVHLGRDKMVLFAYHFVCH